MNSCTCDTDQYQYSEEGVDYGGSYIAWGCHQCGWRTVEFFPSNDYSNYE